jgi:hypothetical protein
MMGVGRLSDSCVRMHMQNTHMHAPGMPRATQAASVEKPYGSPIDGPQLKLGKGR